MSAKKPKCLIIAAGQGNRLCHLTNSKPLIQLGDKKLIEWVICGAMKADIIDFIVVTGYRAERVTAFLTKLTEKYDIHIHLIYNDQWQRENGLSVLKAKNFLNEKFILLMADHIFSEEIILELYKEQIKNSEVILAVDYLISNHPYVNIEDVTKVRSENNRIVNIGKNIYIYNCYDTGIFYCTPVIFSAIEESTQKGDSTLSGGMKILAKKKKARVMDIGRKFWIDVDDEETLQKAKKMLKVYNRM